MRDLLPEDTDDLCEWFEYDPEMALHMVGAPGVIKRGDLEVVLLARATDELQGRCIQRVVVEDNEVVGYVAISPRLGAKGAAHIIIAPWHRGRGIEIAKAAIGAAKDAGLTHLWAFPYNDRIARFMSRVGFATRTYGEIEL